MKPALPDNIEAQIIAKTISLRVERIGLRVEQLIQERKMSSKLTAFVDEVETGTKELEDRVDELRPRFQKAMQSGRTNMGRMASHIDRVEKSIQTVEDFNKRMSNFGDEETKDQA